MELSSYDNSNEYEMFKMISLSRVFTYVLTPSECNER